MTEGGANRIFLLIDSIWVTFQVYFGPSEQSTLAGSYCSNTLPAPITSTTGLYIVFKSDDLANGLGFNISYSKERVAGKAFV